MDKHLGPISRGEFLKLIAMGAVGSSGVLAGIILTGRALEEAKEKTQEQISDFKSLVESFYESNDPRALGGNFYDLTEKLNDSGFKLQTGQSIGIHADYQKAGDLNVISFDHVTVDKDKSGLEITYLSENGKIHENTADNFLSKNKNLVINEAGITIIDSSKNQMVQIPQTFMNLIPNEAIKEVNTVSLYESWSVSLDNTIDTPVARDHNTGFALSNNGQVSYIVFEDLESQDPENKYFFASFTDMNNDPESNPITKADYDAFVNSLK